MIYLKWAVYALLATFINLISVFISPLIALYSLLTNDTRPRVFSWFYTHDNDLNGNSPSYFPRPINPFMIWWYRTCWICRNPGYGFSANVVGLRVSEVTCKTTPTPNGWRDTFLKDGKEVGFGYRKITESMDIWVGWAKPSHDGNSYMLKVKVKPR